MGRWITPDWSRRREAPRCPNKRGAARIVRIGPIPYATLTNPQSLNLYVYVRDNPTTLTDPDGHAAWPGEIASFFRKLACSMKNSCNGQSSQVAANQTNDPQAQKKKGIVQKAKDLAKAHPKATKAIVTTVIVITAISGAFDEGASEAAIPEEEAAGAALESEADAEASESATELTQHASSRMAECGISQSDVEEAISSAKEKGNVITRMGKYGTSQEVYRGSNGVTVVVETAGRNAGKVITVWK